MKVLEHVCLLLTCLISFNECALVEIPLRRNSHENIAIFEEEHHRFKRSDGSSKNLYGHSGEGYYFKIFIGTPPQKINLLIDTGSSNLAVAASPSPEISTYFQKELSSTYKESNHEVHVPYTEGEWNGILGTDVVHLDFLPNVTIRPNIAFIYESDNFFVNGSEWQGIVGLAYEVLARPDESITPFFNTLVTDGKVDNIFGVQLCGSPSTSGDDLVGGALTLGGISSNLYNGDILYTPIQKEWYYEILIIDLQVDNVSLNMDCKEYNFDRTIVDTGTTNVRFPTRVFDNLVKQIKDKHKVTDRDIPDEYWKGDHILCWNLTSLPFMLFPTISISLVHSNSSMFKIYLPPEKYLRMVIDPYFVLQYCFKFGISSSETGTVLGAVLMEGYYVIFDRKNKQIGFASTSCPELYNNRSKPAIDGPIYMKGDFQDCYYKKPFHNDNSMLVVAYVMAGICCLCVLPLIIMILQWQYRRHCSKTTRHEGDGGQLIER